MADARPPLTRRRVLYRAAQLLVLGTAGACHRNAMPEGEFEGEHFQASDPAPPPCNRAANFELKGKWIILDGKRGVVLENLPAWVETTPPTRNTPDGRFAPIADGKRLVFAYPGGDPNPAYCPPENRSAELPDDGPFTVHVSW